jgi:hypothetical protein
MEFISSVGQKFVGVCLMAHIPNDFILRGIKHIMERKGKFHDTQAGGQVPSGFGNSLYDFFPDFLGQ